MSTQKPKQGRGGFLVGSFDGHADVLESGDPVSIETIVVEVERIKLYDGNIRLVPNPKFDELWLAIQTQGPEAAGVLPITRRPNDEHYMIARGGNTRLLILQKLWAQTQDSRFRAVHCLFHPWPGEAKVLADHIAENENRGEMTFIEKALALRDLKQKIEHEAGELLSLREFEKRLNDSSSKFGLRLSKSQLHRLQYASDFLYPLLPDALKSGLGSSHVEQLQKMETRFGHYWRRHRGEPGSDDAFQALFADVLSQHDGPDFTIEVVRQSLEIRLADIFGRSLHTVQASLAALESGLDIAEDGSESETVTGIPCSPVIHRSRAKHARSKLPVVSTVSPALDRLPSEYDISVLRTRTFELARQVAAGHRLEACIDRASSCGLGFWVALPEQSIAAKEITAALWWMLLGLSEQLAYWPSEGINHVAFMPDSELKQLVTTNRWEEVYARVGRGSSWIVLPHQLRISESDTDDLASLFQTIRRLRVGAREADLWVTQQGVNNERTGG